MPSRRSVLAFLGLAPVAAPAAIAALPAPAPKIFGADVTADGVAVVRAGAIRAHSSWEDVLREQDAFFARCDACKLVLPCDPVGDA